MNFLLKLVFNRDHPYLSLHVPTITGLHHCSGLFG
jgi:hypothetical protein